MEYWLYKIIVNSVAPDTYVGYKRVVTGRMKDYFTMKEHKKTVKEITADDLDDFYDYLRENKLKNATIDHYNDNISSAFKFLLKKKLVRYNPTDQINPIVVDVIEVPTYARADIEKLFEVLKGDIIELPTLFDAYYGMRRSEIFGLKKSVFDFENILSQLIMLQYSLMEKTIKKKSCFEIKQSQKKDVEHSLYFQK